MRPLKQGEPRYPVEADAIELLRAEVRYEPAPGQKQRVTAGLLAEGRAPRLGRWLSAPVVAAFLLCAAGASAAAGGGWVTRGYQALAATFRGEMPAEAPSPRRTAPLRAPKPQTKEGSVAPSAATIESRPPVEALAVVEPKLSARAAAVSASRTPSTPVSAARVGAEPAAEKTAHAAREEVVKPGRSAAEDSTLVVGAMRALRQEGRPDTATKQLDEYLKRYPAGALAEEALALSVEAATQRGDSRARDLAERYLARYPNGRFRRAAERARALFSK